MFNSFPFFFQRDYTDCGTTCIRMVAKYYGKLYSPNDLKKKSFVSREGLSLLGLTDLANAIGLKTLAVKISYDKLLEAPGPCIIHWFGRHFVVLIKVKRKSVTVADPAIGILRYRKEEFVQGWNQSNGEGLALLIQPTQKFYNIAQHKGESEKKVGLRYLLSYLIPYKKLIFQLFLGLLAGSLIQLVLPFLTQSIVDIGINTRDINFIKLIVLGQLILFFSRTIVDFIRRWILLHLSSRINITIISDFLLKLTALPISFFDSKMFGDTMQRIGDHTRIEQFLSSSTLNVLFSFFNLIIFGIILGVYNIPVFTVFFMFSLVYILYVSFFLRLRKKLDYKTFQRRSENQNSLFQLILGMQEIKLNTCEKQKRWEWEKVQVRLFEVKIESTKLGQLQDGGSLFINELKNIIITYMTAVAVIKGEMSLGAMLSVQYIIGLLNSPISSFISFIRDFQDAKISLERIGEIEEMDDEESLTSSKSAFSSIPRKADIIVKNLTFHYEGPRSPKVIDNLNLRIFNGKVTAIVGASGSGKTTLLKLLLKFYSISQGAIMLNDTNLTDIRSSDWRKKCGVVMQDSFIFSDTIARNIAVSEDITDHTKLINSVNIANIREFIEELPLGFESKIGNDGIGLSAGQRQRLLIARAVYKNPEFIFFDEATSALDANNERIIIENLNGFFQGKTVVVIAHRLSTVKNADQIVVLDKGKIVEAGTHKELTEKNGAYFELVKNQLELGN